MEVIHDNYFDGDVELYCHEINIYPNSNDINVWWSCWVEFCSIVHEDPYELCNNRFETKDRWFIKRCCNDIKLPNFWKYTPFMKLPSRIFICIHSNEKWYPFIDNKFSISNKQHVFNPDLIKTRCIWRFHEFRDGYSTTTYRELEDANGTFRDQICIDKDAPLPMYHNEYTGNLDPYKYKDIIPSLNELIIRQINKRRGLFDSGFPVSFNVPDYTNALSISNPLFNIQGHLCTLIRPWIDDGIDVLYIIANAEEVIEQIRYANFSGIRYATDEKEESIYIDKDTVNQFMRILKAYLSQFRSIKRFNGTVSRIKIDGVDMVAFSK